MERLWDWCDGGGRGWGEEEMRGVAEWGVEVSESGREGREKKQERERGRGCPRVSVHAARTAG